jgi:hypothetical protein
VAALPSKEAVMKVIITSGKDKWGGDRYYEVKTPKNSIGLADLTECPEDATLNRDLSDIYRVPDMLKEAYEAGKKGEILEFEHTEEGE